MFCETVKIKSTDPEQGDHVVINKEDFDAEKHELFVEPKAPTEDELKAIAEAKEKADADAAAKAKPESKADAKK